MDIVINTFTEQSREILRDNLVGVYLHGSAVMGCYNPAKSDIDLIVVVKEPLEDGVKRRYLDMVIRLNEKGQAQGVSSQLVARSFTDIYR